MFIVFVFVLFLFAEMLHNYAWMCLLSLVLHMLHMHGMVVNKCCMLVSFNSNGNEILRRVLNHHPRSETDPRAQMGTDATSVTKMVPRAVCF
jgi:hypothetical protein